MLCYKSLILKSRRLLQLWFLLSQMPLTAKFDISELSEIADIALYKIAGIVGPFGITKFSNFWYFWNLLELFSPVSPIFSLSLSAPRLSTESLIFQILAIPRVHWNYRMNQVSESSESSNFKEYSKLTKPSDSAELPKFAIQNQQLWHFPRRTLF